MMKRKECCGTCGFPLDIEREPVILTNSILSYVMYEENKCEECGHQADGSTITSVHKHWTDLANRFIQERKELINFLRAYDRLDIEEKKTPCVFLPRFTKPNYKAPKDADITHGDVEEPYSWNVVFHEVLGNTRLSKVMVRDINWDTVSAYINGDAKANIKGNNDE